MARCPDLPMIRSVCLIAECWGRVSDRNRELYSATQRILLHHGYLLTVVPSPGVLLASGSAGAGSVPAGMAHLVAVSYCRNRRGRRSGIVEGDHLPALAPAARKKDS